MLSLLKKVFGLTVAQNADAPVVVAPVSHRIHYTSILKSDAETAQKRLTILRKNGVVCKLRKARKSDLWHVNVYTRQANRARHILGLDDMNVANGIELADKLIAACNNAVNA